MRQGVKASQPISMIKKPTYGATRPTVGRAARRGAAPVHFFSVLIWLVASVLLAATLATAEDREGLTRPSPHDFGATQYCSVCHKQPPPALNLDPMATCTKCHAGNVGNHPVSRHPLWVTPRISVPAYLPLSREGKLVCFTCHDPHNRSGIDKMLRVDFKRLCASCHAGY